MHSADPPNPRVPPSLPSSLPSQSSPLSTTFSAASPFSSPPSSVPPSPSASGVLGPDVDLSLAYPVSPFDSVCLKHIRRYLQGYDRVYTRQRSRTHTEQKQSARGEGRVH